MLSSDFKPAFLNDHTKGIARSNDESFLAAGHTFETFIHTKEDLPRYSIISNYSQIMKIMHLNYIKSQEKDALYRNRDQKDLGTDEEFAQYVEEKNNTRKMSNILKRLHTPKKRTNMNYYNREQIKQ